MNQQKSDKLDPPSLSAASTAVSAHPSPPTKQPGIGIRCLEDPSYSTNSTANQTSRLTTTASHEVVEEARDRFDRYWSKADTAATAEIDSNTATTSTASKK